MPATRDASLIVLGDLPPPVHGQAMVTARVAAALRARGRVVARDLAPGGRGGPLIRIARRVGAVGRAIADLARVRPDVMYMSLGGGAGLAFNVLAVLAGRMFAGRVVLHHHSYAYIDRPARLMSWLCRAAGGTATHVFLSDSMRAAFAARYPLRRARVVGNAAFCEAANRAPETGTGAPRLGLLSNLSAEKGLEDFIALLESAEARGMASRGVLAGPVARARDRAFLAAAQGRLGPCLETLGPVTGAAKTGFFGRIDVFCFPSRYRHEAQPLAVLEALAHGVPVIARGCGCLPALACPPALIVVDRGACFASAAMAWLEAFADEPRTLDEARVAARRYHRELAESARADLAALIADMSEDREAARPPG